MKSHEVETKEHETVLRIKASTKAGLLSETLLAFADACGVVPKKDDEPRPEITGERSFVVEGEDMNQTMSAFCEKVVGNGIGEKEIYMDSKLTLVTDKKVQGELLAIKTGTVIIPWEQVVSVTGPEKNEDGVWVAEVRLK